MKNSDKAYNYLRRLPEKITKTFPDSVYFISGDEAVPKTVEVKRCVALVDKQDTRDVINLANSTGIRHVVQAAQDDFESEIQTAVRMITLTDNFLLDPVKEIFGPDTDPKKFNEMKWPFITFKQKDEIKKEVSRYVERVQNSDMMKKEALSVVDELFKNALLHHTDKELTLHEVREVKFEDHMAATLFAAHYEGRLLIGCTDRFGVLDPQKLLKRLWASFRGDKIQSINMGAGGAGIGCRLILNQCIGFYAGVKKNERTVICGTLSLNRYSKFMMEQSKNFHLSF